MRHGRSRLALALALVAAVLAGACAPAEPLHVMVAASLRGVVDELAHRYEAARPGATVRVETGGSVALGRRVVDLAAAPDLLVLADAALFGELLEPQWTDSHLRYATDRMVLAYTDRSVGADEIDAANWPTVLARPQVSVAMADPDLAPVGYRTVMVLRLLDLLRPGSDLEALVVARVGERNLRANVADLLAPLQAGAVDYAFMYGATARAAGLRSVELPSDMNLGEMRLAATYARVAVDAGPGRPPRSGAPVVYGVALASSTPRRAEALEFLRLALDADGRELLTSHGLVPVVGDDRPVGFVIPDDVQAVLAATAPR